MVPAQLVNNEVKAVAIEGKGMVAILFNAAREGNIETLREQITPGQLPTTPTGKTILHIASEFDKYKCVKEILRLYPSLLFDVDGHGDTALHVAARSGHTGTAEALIEAAKSRDPDIERGNLATVKKFIGMINNKGNTALHEAVDVECQEPYIIIVQLLVKEYPDYEYRPNKRNETPLFVAAERGHGDSALAILQGNKSARHDGPLGRTTLHAAVMSDLERLTKELLEGKPHLAKQTDDDGWTPLHWAAFCDHSRGVRQLLEHDRTLAYMADEDGSTPLHVASMSGSVSSMEIITSLCPDCYDMVDRKGRNALHCAIIFGKESSTRFLLRESLFYSLLSEGDEEGNTPLHLCFRPGAPSFLRWLFSSQNFSFLGWLFSRQNFAVLISRFPVPHRRDFRSLNNNNETARFRPYEASRIIRKDISSSYRKRLLNLSRRFRAPKISMEEEKKLESNKERGDIGQKNKKNKERRDTRSSYLGNQLVVAALIATVSFAAGFTLPGGYNNSGKAILSSKPMFKAFLITDTLAFVFSMMAVYYHFYLPLNTTNLPWKYLDSVGFPLTRLAMLSLLIAFLMGISVSLEPSTFTIALQAITTVIPLIYYFYARGYTQIVNFFMQDEL